jgi:hypothetical protein
MLTIDFCDAGSFEATATFELHKSTGRFVPPALLIKKPHLILGRCTEASLQELSTIGFAFFFPEKSDAEYYVDQIIGYLFSAFDRFCLF